MTVAVAPAGPRERLARALLPGGSLLLLAAMLALVLASAGNTLGYDFEAYVGAARRLIGGDELYDLLVRAAGGFAIYLYPPPFALALSPLTLLPDVVARDIWILALALCLPVGAFLLPVRREVRWLVVALGALDWPFLYSVKLGQVGPLLFILFAAAWRWRNRPARLGVSIALGALVKVQPALAIVWAAVSGRWRAAWIALGFIAAVSAAATVFTGIGAWSDYVTLLARVSSAVATPHNCSPGAVLYQAGLPEAAAEAGQLVSTAAVAAAVVLIWRFGGAEAGLMGTIVASQLATPLLWDHYAMLLLVPTAWFLELGWKWAAVIPLLGWISLFDTAGAWPASASVPLVFFAVLALLLLEANREQRGSASRRHEQLDAARRRDGLAVLRAARLDVGRLAESATGRLRAR